MKLTDVDYAKICFLHRTANETFQIQERNGMVISILTLLYRLHYGFIVFNIFRQSGLVEGVIKEN